MAFWRKPFTQTEEPHDLTYRDSSYRIDPLEEEAMKEREESHVPFNLTPFLDEKNQASRSASLDNGEKRLAHPDELFVDIKEEVGWIDLLLELAMTTAFSNLADNTPINTAKDAASYIAFFALVWWIWASQVAYNMRFRQGDWLHRTCAFATLAIFSAMAAFTNNFDITSGLTTGDDADEQTAANISVSLGITNEADLQAQGIRDARLPVLNARGIAIIVTLSRLLLLAQYFLVFHHARRFRRQAILAHIIALAISSGFYLISFIILTPPNPSPGTNIAKIFLWFAAIIIEIGSLFVANSMPGRVAYPGPAVIARSSTLFIIVLGTGLDKITGQFKFVIGTLGFGAISVLVGFSTIAVLIGYFSLYFNGGEKISGGSNRALAYFLMHFPFMAALIVMLRGVASLLSYVNFARALQEPLNVLFPLLPKISLVNRTQLTLEDISNASSLFDQVGLSAQSTLDAVNGAINATYIELTSNSFTYPDGTTPNWTWTLLVRILQIFSTVAVSILKEFEALPDEGSPLYLEIEQFIVGDPHKIDPNQWGILYNNVAIERLNPSLWFLGTSGAVFLMLGVLMLLKTWPRDKWEWIMFYIRIVPGVILSVFSLFNINSSRPFLSIKWDAEGAASGSETNSVIWKLADSGWILPLLAAILIVANWGNSIIIILARRADKIKINRARGHMPHVSNMMSPFLDLAPPQRSSSPSPMPSFPMTSSYTPPIVSYSDNRISSPPPGAMVMPTATPYHR